MVDIIDNPTNKTCVVLLMVDIMLYVCMLLFSLYFDLWLYNK